MGIRKEIGPGVSTRDTKSQPEVHYLVISRSCAYLYDEIAKLFADRPDIKVVVDRRRGKGRMAEIPGLKDRRRRGRVRRSGQAE